MRVTPDTLKQFGGERSAALASQVSSPSPFFYTYPVIAILNRYADELVDTYTGSLEEELRNEYLGGE